MEKVQLTVDDGSIEVEVANKAGEILGTFVFNPTDLDIIKRYENVVNELKKIKVAENADDKEVFRISDIISEQFNVLLNNDVSKTLFSKCNPLTPLENGEFFYLEVISQIGKLIDRTCKTRINPTKVNNALKKYRNK